MEDIGISCHRPDVVARDKVWKDPLGDLPVLQHIAYAAGRAQVVLQDVKSSILIADEVDTRDVDIDIVRDLKAMHLPEKMGAAVDHLDGNDPVFEDELTVVDVFQKE